MFQLGSWSQLFSYKEQTYRDSTLVVLSTFEVDKAFVMFNRTGSIRFQLFREQQQLSFIEFTLLLGLYDTGFTSTPQNE